MSADTSGIEVNPKAQLDVPKIPANQHYADKYTDDGPPFQTTISSVEVGLEKSRKLCGLEPAVFWLSIALAFMTIAFAVGTGVAGSLASKRAQQNCSVAAPLSTPNSKFIPNSSPASTSTSTSSSPTTASESTPTPSSDCSKLPTSYKAQSNHNQTFSIDCGADYLGDDLLGVYVFSFETCINACASYSEHADETHSNSTCYGVSFNAGMSPDVGNCWLKSGEFSVSVSNSTVADSAVANPSSQQSYTS